VAADLPSQQLLVRHDGHAVAGEHRERVGREDA